MEYTSQQQVLIAKHGTPEEFAVAVMRRIPGYISRQEAAAAIWKYNQEFVFAGLTGTVSEVLQLEIVKLMEEQMQKAEEKLSFLASKGLVVGIMKEAGKEPRLGYDIKRGSEFDDTERIVAEIDKEIAIEKAFAPVNDWYQSDERHKRPFVDRLTDAVADLQRDRAEVIELRNKNRVLEEEAAGPDI